MRIGNAAYRQLQLDIYGELMDAVYLHNKYVEPVSYDNWVHLRGMVDWLCDNWQRDDEGNLGSTRRPATFRLFEAHVLGRTRPRPAAGRQTLLSGRSLGHWLKVRDEIYEEVMTKGFDPGRKAFVQAYGSDGSTPRRC